MRRFAPSRLQQQRRLCVRNFDRQASVVGGSPSSSVLGAFVWTWFKFQDPAYQHTQSKTTSPRRRNLVALALEWRQILEYGEAASRAELARRIGVTRAHVTQVLSLNYLVLEAKKTVLSLGHPIEGKMFGIHTFRSPSSLLKGEQAAWIEAYKAGAV